MQINIYSIEKKEEYKNLIDDFIKQSRAFANVNNITIFNNKIAKAQNPQASYREAFEKYLDGGFNIVLTPEAKTVDSYKFSSFLEDRQKINFFIGGAYGFDEEFKNSCDIKLSLTPLTLSHKIAKLMLFEQIYRGLSILNNHPYHK
jgi:23S rRNA (pseudouridine1915-N3)-methyltransferase